MTDNNDKTVQEMTRYLLDQGMTPEEVAFRSGVTIYTVTRWKKRGVGVPHGKAAVEKLKRLYERAVDKVEKRVAEENQP